MDLHANAALSLNKRRLLCRRVVEEQWTVTKAAAAAEVSVRCARKWIARYRADGEVGLIDHSSAPSCVANRTPEDRIQAIAALRRLRFTGPEQARAWKHAQSLQPSLHRPPRQGPPHRRLGVRPHRDRRLHQACLRRGAHRRKGSLGSPSEPTWSVLTTSGLSLKVVAVRWSLRRAIGQSTDQRTNSLGTGH
jgi:transposase IS481 family protein